MARILAGRNVEVDAVEAFLDPTIKRSMPDPNVLTAMPEAAERLADAITRGETVAIFGDYDVDGATSAAVLARFLRHAGIEPLIHIPDRLFEGYGPNVEAVRALAARGATLLVTVDCGTTSIEPLAEARALGVDVVVIDHHQADEVLPPAVAIVNPNRRDDLSGLGHLAAVGLVFMTVVAANRVLRARGFWTAERPEPDLLAFLDDVALGTVADVVPLIGLNRAFVAKGLIALRRRERAGHVSLMDAARLSGPPEAWHLGFLLGPRINAGGRIGRADLGVRLLLEDDPDEAAKIAAELDRLNRERQAIEVETLAQAEAEAMAALGIEEKGAVVVTAAEGWHPGVVGIVAGRLKEKFGRPAFAIALEPGGIGTGSGRSIVGVDIGRAVRRAVSEGLLTQGRRPCHGGRRDAAQSRARAAARLFRGDARPRGGSRAARAWAFDRRRGERRRRRRSPRRHDRARRPVRLGQSGAGDRAAGAHAGARRGGRAGAYARAAEIRRRRWYRRHRLPRRRTETRRRALAKPRPANPRRRLVCARPLAGRRAGAVPVDRYRAGGAVHRAVSMRIRVSLHQNPAL